MEIALNGKRQFLTLGTRMRDSFINLENQNSKLTFNGTAIPEQPRQIKRYAYNSVDYINFSSGLYFLNVPVTTSVKAAASLSALTSSNPKNRSHAFPFSFTYLRMTEI